MHIDSDLDLLVDFYKVMQRGEIYWKCCTTDQSVPAFYTTSVEERFQSDAFSGLNVQT